MHGIDSVFGKRGFCNWFTVSIICLSRNRVCKSTDFIIIITKHSYTVNRHCDLFFHKHTFISYLEILLLLAICSKLSNMKVITFSIFLLKQATCINEMKVRYAYLTLKKTVFLFIFYSS